ncbi:MAG: ATP-binding protein [Clostridiales bacterium]|jgi:DNA replication protein DnaC|nr:ATP-binding protein [Clostridiales bacterium]
MALKKDKYNQIVREYDNRQLKNKHELDMRRKEVFEAVPELKQLEHDMISLSAQCGRLAVMGDSSSLDKLKTQSLDLQARQIELLVSNGYPADYLELRYHCDTCKDTGFVDGEKCNCYKQAVADLLYSDSNLKNILLHENFNYFSFQYYSDDYIDDVLGVSPLTNIQKIVAGCKSYIKNFDKNKDNLLFMGNTGVGKTFLCNCIAKELLDKGYTVIYLTAFRLFDILEKYKFGRDTESSIDASNQFSYILDCDLLIIDDLGTEMNNTFTTSQLYLIINERMLREKSTIISTNLSYEDINSKYGERIYSRVISKYSIRRIIGKDIRKIKAFNNI